MAQKSTREGLKKEYVDYLGNLIIDGKIKFDIVNLTNGLYPSKQSFNNLADSLASEIEARTASDDMLSEDITENRDKISVLQNKTRINYLRPTLQTQTDSGVTCTNNGDGTYTLNGTASADVSFYLTNETFTGNLKLIGTPINDINARIISETSDGFISDKGNGCISTNFKSLFIRINSGTTANNLVFKPMITDDLSVTYDDFVSGFDCLTPDLKMDLLWANASPTSVFGPQTINLDLSKYEAVLIQAVWFTGWAIDNNSIMQFMCNKGEQYLLNGAININAMKKVNVTDSSIIFGDSNIINTYSSDNLSVNNAFLVPKRIYGVR